MSDNTGIEWTDATWNPVTGCAKVSQGCKNCYALRDWARLSKIPGSVYYEREFADVRCHPERLDQPLRWRRPRRIFVNSMSDLFHPDVPDGFIDRVFAVMALAPRHHFQVLTKRPRRMRDYLSAMLPDTAGERWYRSIKGAFRYKGSTGAAGPEDTIPTRQPPILPNVWLGVSVEDQETADERIPLLLQTPAAVRWISAEPLLGPIDLCDIPAWDGLAEGQRHVDVLGQYAFEVAGPDYIDTCNIGVGINWESGPHARPSNPDWFRLLRDQCAAADVPFLFKQWGEWCHPMQLDGETYRQIEAADIDSAEENKPIRVGKKAAGRTLDGREWNEYPT